MPGHQQDPRRRFSVSQRQVLVDLADARCEQCGADLADGFHADHQLPHSMGGRTDVSNGAALCPTCNNRKGITVITAQNKSSSVRLRPWQAQALRQLHQHPNPAFLMAATPGAGKTLPALEYGRRLQREGRIDRIVVLTPTRSLCDQWANKAHARGLALDPDCGVVEPPDIHGVVLTYSGLAHAAEHQRALAARRATLVIGDEIHHLGEQRRHGGAFTHAFEAAERFLLLSGTPFRSDSNRIPKIVYDKYGVSVPDFTYGYAEAVRDGICRRIVFEEWDGSFSWLSDENGPKEATFRDELSPCDAGRRLRTALAADLAGMRSMLSAADRKLSEVREHHPDAGGLAVAIDINHATAIAEAIQDLTGEAATLVTSDEPDAQGQIDAFSESAARWLVAVNIVSEGVDIPRLRVGVYATNVTTPMRFRQIVGRFVRVGSGPDEGASHLFLPADDRLVREAERISNEITHDVSEEDAPPDHDAGRRGPLGEHDLLCAVEGRDGGGGGTRRWSQVRFGHGGRRHRNPRPEPEHVCTGAGEAPGHERIVGVDGRG